MKIWVFVFYGSLLSVGFLSGEARAEDSPKRIVCYLSTYTRYYKRPYKYGPEDIPTELCTDVVFDYLTFGKVTFEIEIPASLSDLMFQFTTLKSSSVGPNLLVKVKRSWYFASDTWSSMMSEASKRSMFVDSALRLVRELGLSGLDLDWIDPKAKDRENFVKLVEELVVAFKPLGLLLTSTVYVKNIVNEPNIRETGYDIQKLSELLDWMNVKTDNLRDDNNNRGFVDVPSPLYPRPFDVDELKNLNVHDCLEILGSLGAPRHKLVVGVSFRGHSYSLRNTGWPVYPPGPDSPVNASFLWGNPGPVTNSRGFLAYFEICRMISIGHWKKRFDYVGKCPYAFHWNQWIGYEDEQSIRIKMEYVRNRGYGGAYVRSVNFDDFNGFCGSKNPLLRTVHEALMSKKDEPTVDSQEVTLRKRYEAMGIVPKCKASTKGVAGVEDFPKRIVCYFRAKTHVFKPPYNYGLGDIPTELCTDVVFDFLPISNETFEIEIPDDISDVLHQFTTIGSSSGGPNLLVKVKFKWLMESHWGRLLPDESKRSSLVASALRLVRERGFAGLDLDWNDPEPKDTKNFVKLVEELDAALKPFGLILISTVYVTLMLRAPNIMETGYDIQRLSELLDWMNVETGSLRYSFNGFVDVPSPLYRRPFDVDKSRTYNVHDCLEVLGSLSAPRHKLVMGVSFTGISYTLRSRSATYLYAPYNLSAWRGNPGPVTNISGFLSYFEICQMISIGKWTKRFDHVGKCPYAFHGDQWVGYEDEQSIRIKMEYVRNRGYGGAYLMDINYDDFNGFCGSKNPLLRTVHEALMSKKDEPIVDSQKLIIKKRYEAMGIVPTCRALSQSRTWRL